MIISSIYYLYNSKNQLESHVDGEAYVTDYRYDLAGNIVDEIRHARHLNEASIALLASQKGLVNRQILEFDATENISGAESLITSFLYNNLNQRVGETNPYGIVTEYGYNAAGQLIQTTVAADVVNDSEAHSERVIQWEYDAYGRLVKEVSAEAFARSIAVALPAIYKSNTYDEMGRLISSTNELGQSQYFYYDQNGALRYSVDALGQVVEYQYNRFGELLSTTEYSNSLDLSSYSPSGGLVEASTITSMVDALGGTAANGNSQFQYSYDKRGLVSSSQDALGYDVDYQYNAFSQLIQEDHWQGAFTLSDARQVRYFYDRRGLLTETRQGRYGDNVRLAWKQIYDGFGRLKTSVDANGQQDNYVYDTLGNINTVLRNQQRKSSIEYDAFGRVLNATDALEHVTAYRYDDETRSFSLTTEDGVSTVTQLNAFGETFKRTEQREGQEYLIAEFQYDDNGQVVSIDDNIGQQKTFEYDVLGQLIKTDAQGVVTAYHYDAIGRALSIVRDPDGQALKVSYQYSEGGRSVTESSHGEIKNLQYDAHGQLIEEIIDPYGEALFKRYSYNAMGNVYQIQQGQYLDGEAQVKNTQHFAYDLHGYLVEDWQNDEDYSLRNRYEVDNEGNILAQTVEGVRQFFTYDDEYQLRFSVDGLGRLSEYRYDANRRLVERLYYTEAMYNGGPVYQVVVIQI